MENENPNFAAPLVAASNEESNWGVFAHLSALIGLLIPFGNILAPWLIWLIKGKESAYIEAQAKEALNFQITLLLAFLLCFLLSFVLIGLFLLVLVGIAGLVFVLIATVAASKGQVYRYPFSLRLVK